MHDLEQLMARTAFAPVGPLDLDAVERRGARRHTAQLAATFAGAIAALVFAMSLVGTTLPTSAPVIGEVPEGGETVDGAPAEEGEGVSVRAVDALDRRSASAESPPGVGADGIIGAVGATGADGARQQGGTWPGAPAPGAAASMGEEVLVWDFNDGDDGWEWGLGSMPLSVASCDDRWDKQLYERNWIHDVERGAFEIRNLVGQLPCVEDEPRVWTWVESPNVRTDYPFSEVAVHFRVAPEANWGEVDSIRVLVLAGDQVGHRREIIRLDREEAARAIADGPLVAPVRGRLLWTGSVQVVVVQRRHGPEAGASVPLGIWLDHVELRTSDDY